MEKSKHQDWLKEEGLLQLEAVIDIPAIDLGTVRTYRLNDTGNWIDEEI